MTAVAYPHGIDACWLAVDESGFVAAFITGGEGPIPASALPAVVGGPDLETQIVALPIVSVKVALANAYSSTSFTEIAERGLFVFDWADVHRTQGNLTGMYELVCRPNHPIKVAALPIALQEVARATLLPKASFSDANKVLVAP